jgi:hypothetical protein
LWRANVADKHGELDLSFLRHHGVKPNGPSAAIAAALECGGAGVETQGDRGAARRRAAAHINAFHMDDDIAGLTAGATKG